jgi:hypothetical protein
MYNEELLKEGSNTNMILRGRHSVLEDLEDDDIVN